MFSESADLKPRSAAFALVGELAGWYGARLYVLAVRVDVTEEFPFLVTKLSPYYDR